MARLGTAVLTLTLAGMMTASRPADACDCLIGGKRLLLPRNGATDVPLDATILAETFWGAHGLRVVDVSTGAVVELQESVTLRTAHASPAFRLSPATLLEPDTDYEVQIIWDESAAEPEPVGNFTTGQAERSSTALSQETSITAVSASSDPYIPFPSGADCGPSSTLSVEVTPEAHLVLFDFTSIDGEADDPPAHVRDFVGTPNVAAEFDELELETTFDSWTSASPAVLNSFCGGPLPGGYLDSVVFRTAAVDASGNIAQWSPWQTKTIPPAFLACSCAVATKTSSPWWPVLMLGSLLVGVATRSSRRQQPARSEPDR